MSYYIQPWTATTPSVNRKINIMTASYSEQHLHICVEFNKMVILKGTWRHGIYHARNSRPHDKFKNVPVAVCSDILFVFLLAISDITHGDCQYMGVILITFLLSFQLLDWPLAVRVSEAIPSPILMKLNLWKRRNLEFERLDWHLPYGCLAAVKETVPWSLGRCLP